MRLSFNWLMDFVEARDLSAQEVADKLTMGAFEVEEIRKAGPDIKGPVKVGQIVEISKHPNADKIRLTKVALERRADLLDNLLDIVCGADNIAVGQKVPVALPGAKVVNRHDGSEFYIKPVKIRGVESNGMLCSPGELGISDGDPEGILVLPDTCRLGSDVVELLHLYPDHILHVGTRSNRGDALCVLGVAREVSALCGRPLKEPKWQLPDIDPSVATIDVRIENNNNIDCPYFSLRVLTGLKVKPSPLLIRRRLESIGLRSVNNIVDITNYVLHELGQPLHAYDLDKLKSRQMDIRRAGEGETIVTLDGRKRKLSPEVLLVAEGARALAVAGVMGGHDSEITQETTAIALEAAAFQAARVRRASRLLGLSSDSSLRFERGVDPACVRKASDRAAALILESCGGVPGGITSAGSDKVEPLAVQLRLPQLERLAEINLDGGKASALLESLGFTTKAISNKELKVFVPSYRRSDVTREIDLIEEICRLYGYDQVKPSMPRSTVAPARPDDTVEVARQALTACGLNEAYTSSLVGLNLPGTSDSQNTESFVRVLNPLSEDHQLLRQSLSPGLIQAAAYNQDRGAADIWLFEIGRVFKKTAPPSTRQTGVHEEVQCAGVLAGLPALSHWQDTADRQASSNFYASKGVVENLLDKLSIDRQMLSFSSLEQTVPYLHPGRSCRINLSGGKKTMLGWLGDLHPAIADKLGLRLPFSLFELKLDVLSSARRIHSCQEVYTTPNVVRDLTADFKGAIEHEQVVRSIAASAGDSLKALELISIFQLPGGLRSLTYRLTFQHKKESLTAQAVELNLEAIRKHLKAELEADFRA